MTEIIDLSQEIFGGMPVFSGMPEVGIRVHITHEQQDGITDSDTISPAVHRMTFGEHTGTHVDALNHMARQYRAQSIDTMPLSTFYTEGICLDLSHKGLQALIEPADLEKAMSSAGLEIRPGDTVLLYTDHYRRAFGTESWRRGPGLERGRRPLVGREADRGLRRGDGGARRQASLQQGSPSHLRQAGLHSLREPHQSTPARRAGPLSIYRSAAQDPRGDWLASEGCRGVRRLTAGACSVAWVGPCIE